MKHKIKILTKTFLLAAIALCFFLLQPETSSAAVICTPGTDTLASCTNNIYAFSIGLATFVGVLMFIIAGYFYSSGGDGIKKAKEIISSTIAALLILIGTYAILNTIDPNLTSIRVTSFPSNINIPVDKVDTPPAPPACSLFEQGKGICTPVDQTLLTQAQADQMMQGTRVTLKAGASLAGTRRATLQEIIDLSVECGCDIVITSGTDGNRGTQGACSHATGWKVDLRTTPEVTSYIKSNFTYMGIRSSDGAKAYRDQATGAVYYYEEVIDPVTKVVTYHWDVVAPGCTG